MPQFYTSRNRLTSYSLACGYLEEARANGEHLTLWREHGVYHVRQHSEALGRIFWGSFRLLVNARRCFDDAKRKLTN